MHVRIWVVFYGLPLLLENKEFEYFNLFPNPVHDVLYFESGIPIKKAILYDQLGRSVKSFNWTEAKVNSMNMAELDSGVYYLMIEFNSEKINSLIKKILIL